MNILTARQTQYGRAFAALVLSSIFLAACATTPASPPGAADVRAKLNTLQNDPNLAERARVELRQAEEAVRLAEQPVSAADAQLGEHRIYMAERKVEIARAKATTRYLEDQRALFGEERARERLEARTREAEAARRSEAEAEAEAARMEAELRRQIDILEAEATERGLVLILGDVLFATASAELRGGAFDSLNKLANFLNEYPDRRVLIEGHTDNVGSAEYNQGLSQRRAESVRSYLMQQGIASHRLSASGMGLNRPIADNNTAAGRQQNRRVEIIIEHPPLSSSAVDSRR